VARIVPDEAIALATAAPPETTRAWFRGGCVRRFPDSIVSASWDSLVVDTGEATLRRIPMREPLRGTRSHVEAVLDGAADMADLVARLSAGGAVGGRG